ncbi:MAG: hypothetical protein E6J91_23740 [Deltaproteobacteria bacterium]|nr:MAG: hypothetical protein E6J91_23740 [Deltaproteobacteria bacterium]
MASELCSVRASAVDDRRQQAAAQARPDDEALQRPAHREHHRHHHRRRDQGRDAQRHQPDDQEVRRDHDQIAVGELHHAHRAEADRHAQADQTVEAAEQASVEQGLDQLHRHPK